MENYKIYCLKDPKFTSVIRYVGLTGKSLEERLKQHLFNQHKTYKSNWINSLKLNGLIPKIELLEENLTFEQANIKEVQYIRMFRDMGYPLTNLTDGGKAMRGYKYTDEVKKKMSDALKGHSVSQETREKIRAKQTWQKGENNPMFGKPTYGGRGVIWSDESRKKSSLSHLGYKHTEEAKLKMKGRVSSFKGKKHTEETKTKIREKRALQIFTTETRNKISLANRGEKSKQAKLKETDIINIRDLYKNNIYKTRKLAQIYNVTFQCIAAVIKYKSWRHIS